MHRYMEERVNNKKCYNCGKEFRTPADLARHKNRKTPCLIRDVTADDLNNPLRCIFCNKVFSRKDNLRKHYGVCKIKNGGMEILSEKVRVEQEFMASKMAQMQEQIDTMSETIKNLAHGPVTNNYTVNNTDNSTHNTIINFSDAYKPAINKFNLTDDELVSLLMVRDDIARKLIELIYFNENIPENHTVYMPNLRENRLLVYREGNWQHIFGDDIKCMLVSMRNASYVAGCDKINDFCDVIHEKSVKFDRIRASFVGHMKETSIMYNHGKLKCTDKEVMELIKNKRELVAHTLRLIGLI